MTTAIIRRPAKPRADKKAMLLAAWQATTREPWPFLPEVRFHPVRMWRFDWGSREHMLAIELDGVVFSGKGRHQTAGGLEGDHEKGNAALLGGWRTLKFTQRQVAKDPVGTVATIKAALAMSPPVPTRPRQRELL